MSSASDFEEMGVDFQEALKEFIEKSDQLKKNQLHRVSKALAAQPLEEDLITLVGPQEEEVYEIGKKISSIKLSMMIESLKQDAEEHRIKEAKSNRAIKENKNG